MGKWIIHFEDMATAAVTAAATAAATATAIIIPFQRGFFVAIRTRIHTLLVCRLFSSAL